MTPLITRLLKLLIIYMTIAVVIGLLRSSLCEVHIIRGNLEIKAIYPSYFKPQMHWLRLLTPVT